MSVAVKAKERLTQRLWKWVDERTKISTLPRVDVPKHATNPIYCLGGITFLAFLVQGITGIMLAIYYRPSLEFLAGGKYTQAYGSILYIIEEVRYGSFIRSIHHYAANLMILTVILHMLRVYFTGGYKKPRELNWMAGLILGSLILAAGFTGYLLPWTDQSRGALTTGMNIVSTVPGIGDLAYSIMVGTSDEETLKRFYAFHILWIPGAFAILVLLHFFMIKKHGISGPL